MKALNDRIRLSLTILISQYKANFRKLLREELRKLRTKVENET
jgi:hypothetical protein